METELTEKKMQQLAKQPIIESGISTSEDGKWVIHRTVITDIKSRAYLEKVLSDEEGSEDSSSQMLEEPNESGADEGARFESRDGSPFIDGKKVVKGWESFPGWYWFATGIDCKQDSVINGREYKDDTIYFGFVQGREEEWGCFSEAELNSLGKHWVWEIPAKDLPYSGRSQR